MKKFSVIAILSILFCLGGNASGVQKIIPLPAEYSETEGYFKVPNFWSVKSDLPEATTDKLLKVLKQNFEIVNKNARSLVDLYLEEDKSIAEEDYTLEVQPQSVVIKAGSEKGFYYGLQSLYQLCYLNGGNDKISCCTITDSPRFEYRSLMLDPVRYFIPKEEVLKIIDLAGALKFNNLHLHLTDDNGWRMEIKKYPKLTETGAWRVDRPEIFPGRMNAESADEPTPVGGFYTQDDLREIVDYAAQRYINVVPEIEMPAHAAAAIASYPELACPVVDKFVGVFPGIGGPDASIIMCGGNDQVFEFYKDVLDEVIDIFPSPYIHLGGDEADKSIWEQCELCNQRIQELGLKDYEELQAYFMDTINSYVRSKGRTAMGWDEVTYGDPKEDMVILGWQGTGNVAVNYAKKTGRKFIMTPAKLLYLLRYQGPQWFEPFTYFGNNTLKDVYLYEPVQENWTPELKDQLLGVQGSLWTEFCYSPTDVEYLLFPRVLAVADLAWRPEGTADWETFTTAVDNFLPELDERDIIYARSMYNIQHKATPEAGEVVMDLECERPDVDIMYTLRGDENNQHLYTGPISFKNPTAIIANTYKDGKPMGHPLVLNVGFNKATGAQVTSSNCNNDLEYVLTNGLRGSDRHSDMEWAGWHNRDAEFIVDLGEIEDINNINLGGIAFSHVCVALPESVEIYGSEDGNDFTLLATEITPQELVYAKESTKHEYAFRNLDSKARFLKVKAKNAGKIPEGYARTNAPTWIYFDEITVD